MKNKITQEQLKKQLHYDPETGVFTWLVSNQGRCQAGKVAGAPHAKGYRQLQVAGMNNLEHRLVWLYVHGYFPGAGVDHINGDRADNRLANLRLATNSENQQNLPAAGRGGSSGRLGVSLDGRTQKWRAYITVDKVRWDIGRFSTKEAASEAYRTAKAQLHTFSPSPRGACA